MNKLIALFLFLFSMFAYSDEPTVMAFNALPGFDLGKDTTLCNGKTLYLDAGVGFKSYVWSDGSTSQTLAVKTGGKYFVTVTDENGILYKDSIKVNFLPLPVINITLTPDSVKFGSCTQIYVSGGAYYSWQPSFYLSDTTIANPVACPYRSMNFYVKVTGANGCSIKDTVSVKVYDYDLFIPNTFTPYCACSNEKWEIRNIERFKGNSLKVYNRWGLLVYTAENYKNDWDGEGLPVGTYYYVLYLEKGGKPITGDVNLLK
ncbi:MAG: gliding motility-associated C-terminal domain-containing protein [Bacteroidales bacterium]|nr:gliding motility-associated C-terminal domain-containing protein [Bacteroidales bacterium]